MSDYLGDIFKRNVNSKLDELCKKILQSHKNRLGIVGVHPAIVYWKHQKNCKCEFCFERLRGIGGIGGTQNPVSESKNNFYNTKWFDKQAANEAKKKKI